MWIFFWERERKLQRWSVISLRAWSASERSDYPLTLLSCQLQLAAFLSVTMVLTLCPPTPTHHMLDGGCYHWLCSRGSADLPADNSELNLLDNIQGLVRRFAAEVGSECYTTTMTETHKRRIRSLSILVLISWFARWESLAGRKGWFIMTVAHSRYLIVRSSLEGTHKVSWGFFFPSGQIFTTPLPTYSGSLIVAALHHCTASQLTDACALTSSSGRGGGDHLWKQKWCSGTLGRYFFLPSSEHTFTALVLGNCVAVDDHLMEW